jgi:hypothetical protein
MAGLKSKENRTDQALTGRPRRAKKTEQIRHSIAGLKSKEDRTDQALTGWTRE